MKRMRLDRFFFFAGNFEQKRGAQRYKAEEDNCQRIACSKVDMSIDAEVDIICLDGRAIHYEPFIYLMLNKPQGVVSATEDRSHMTVLDLVHRICFVLICFRQVGS